MIASKKSIDRRSLLRRADAAPHLRFLDAKAAKGRKMNELITVEKISQWHNEREVRILAETTGRYSFPRKRAV